VLVCAEANNLEFRSSMEFKMVLTRTYTILKTSSSAKMVRELQTIGEMDIKLENWFMRISWK
jgi:hypothetical protein